MVTCLTEYVEGQPTNWKQTSKRRCDVNGKQVLAARYRRGRIQSGAAGSAFNASNSCPVEMKFAFTRPGSAGCIVGSGLTTLRKSTSFRMASTRSHHAEIITGWWRIPAAARLHTICSRSRGSFTSVTSCVRVTVAETNGATAGEPIRQERCHLNGRLVRIPQKPAWGVLVDTRANSRDRAHFSREYFTRNHEYVYLLKS